MITYGSVKISHNGSVIYLNANIYVSTNNKVRSVTHTLKYAASMENVHKNTA